MIPSGFRQNLQRQDSPENTWSSTGALQIATYSGSAVLEAACAKIGTDIYVGLGIGGAVYRQDWYKYNTLNDTWTAMTTFPGAGRGAAGSFTIAKNIYICGGRTAASTRVTDCWQYNTTSDTWKQVATFSGSARSEVSAFSINDMGYVVGGTTDGSTAQLGVYKYNPLTDAWSQGPSMSQARFQGTSFVVNNVAYVGCGQATGVVLSDLSSFDGTTWTAKTSMPSARENLGQGDSGMQQTGYVLGGYTATTAQSTLFEYNTITNTWATMSSYDSYDGTPNVIYDHVMASVEGKLYAGVGAYAAGETATKHWAVWGKTKVIDPIQPNV